MARKIIGWLIAEAYRFVGIRARRIRELKREEKILPIVFHASKAEDVRAILAWLKRAGVLEKAELTFDDGWKEFRGVVKVLEEFDKRAILFIAPGETLRGKVWTDGLTISERQSLYGRSASERGNYRGTALLSEREIKDIAKHPLIRIGNHTWSHLSATSRPREETLDEIVRAQKTLTEWCGYEPTDFAYPFGRGNADLDAEIRKLGMTPYYTRQGFVTTETRGLARNMVYEGMSLAENLGRIFMAWPKVGETL